MDRVFLSWNFANWATVLLMAAAGYAALTLASQVVLHRPPGGMQTGG
jgi:hypothetical protein